MNNTILDLEKNYKEQLEKIFKNEEDYSEIDVFSRGYGIHKSIILNSILFVGINPSFSGNDPGSYFIHLNQDGQNPGKGGETYPYFKKFVEIAKLFNLQWSHQDVLFLRETKQANVGKIHKQKNGDKFIEEQLKISKEIIIKSKPKVIVISNTQARYYMKGEMGFKFEFDPNLGTRKIVSPPELKDTPVFFTSMLTGQRALDLGSYERLIWHIGSVLKIDNFKGSERLN
ncbi:hypothetical protein [Tenacibaculum aiptasiae]|uniref:hypothetical protein n=1 Tax=Tenacibaculum aiptasiae TaxID=426481 RepID=UPI00232E636E|nr:hypothetical protein [Tenacibaculum aiptasiae]